MHRRKIQALGRGRRPRPLPVRPRQDHGQPVGILPAQAHFQQGTHHDPHHIVQECVSPHRHPGLLAPALDAYQPDLPDRASRLAAGGPEGGEIPPPLKVAGRSRHGRDVQ